MTPKFFRRSILRNRHCAILFIPVVLAVAGCTSLIGGKTEIPERRKFNLVIHPLRLRLPDSRRPYPFDLQVKAFTVPNIYDRNQMVFRLSPFESKDDRWNIWAERPSKHVTDVIQQYLDEADLFARISQEYLDKRPDYVLSGNVKAIERFDSGDLWFAHLEMTMSLVDAGSTEMIWKDEFDETVRVYKPDMVSTVETLSQILRSEVEKAIKDIDFKFTNKLRLQEGQELLDRELISLVSGEATAADLDSLDVLYDSQSSYELIPGKLAPEND